MGETYRSYQEYKTWLNGITGQEEQTESANAEQMASDLRVKGYITRTVQEDNIISKMIGLGLIQNGYIDPALAQLFFIDRWSKR